MNGTNEYEGRVEVRINGTWGTICDSYPSFQDATVICRQLGFQVAERAARGAVFGAGSLNASIAYLSCRGTESSVTDCYYYSGPNLYCDTNRYAIGVLCSDGEFVCVCVCVCVSVLVYMCVCVRALMCVHVHTLTLYVCGNFTVNQLWVVCRKENFEYMFWYCHRYCNYSHICP